MDAADGNYSINPWNRPQQRLGDDVDPSVFLDPAMLIYEVATTAPMVPPAGRPQIFLGYERPEPGINDVLQIGPASLMANSPDGMQGTLGPSLGA